MFPLEVTESFARALLFVENEQEKSLQRERKAKSEKTIIKHKSFYIFLLLAFSLTFFLLLLFVSPPSLDDT